MRRFWFIVFQAGFGLLLLLLFCGCATSPRVLLGGGGGGAAQSSSGTVIVFASAKALDSSDAPNSNATPNIWSMNSDGSNARPLTSLTALGGISAFPVWSPNGNKIAFESFRALDGSNGSVSATNIWVMNSDGTALIDLTQLTASLVTCNHSSWSPDGRIVAYDSTRALDGTNSATGVPNIWVASADRSSSTTLTKFQNATNESPVWSPDGKKLLFVSSRSLNGNDVDTGIRNIWVMNADGSSPQPLTNLTAAASSDPVWSPDGKKIAYVSLRTLDGLDNAGAPNVWVMNADGTGSTPVTRLTNGFNMTIETPIWSPDSSKIVYDSTRALDGSDNGGMVLNVWVVNADGTGQRAVTALTAAASSQPRWSPDGSKIIFRSSRALSGTNAPNLNSTFNIWVINSDGTGASALTRMTASAADSASPQWH